MRLTFSLLVAILAVSLSATAASARTLGPVAAGASCKAGFKAARVGGVLACLKAGQACSAKHDADYTRAAFTCLSGHLRAKPAASTTTKTAVVGPGSSRSNPVPLGKPGALGNGWTLTITSVNPDATSAILAAEPGNTAPLEGMQYVLVSVSASYNGPGSSHLTPATSFHAIGAANIVHTSANSYCGKLPSPNIDLDNPLVYKGHAIAGYAGCWMVPATDVSSLELYYQPFLATSQVWFALR